MITSMCGAAGHYRLIRGTGGVRGEFRIDRTASSNSSPCKQPNPTKHQRESMAPWMLRPAAAAAAAVRRAASAEHSFHAGRALGGNRRRPLSSPLNRHNHKALIPQETRKFMQHVSSCLSLVRKSHERMITAGLESNELLKQIRDDIAKIPQSSPKPSGFESLLVAWGFKPPEDGIWRKLWMVSFVISMLLAQSLLVLRIRDMLRDKGTSI